MGVNKRELLVGVAALAASSGLAAAQGVKKPVTYGPQRKAIPHGMVKTSKLFKSPPGFVNALAVAPEGIWLGQQKLSGKAANPITCQNPRICAKPPGWSIGTASCSRPSTPIPATPPAWPMAMAASG